jgi:hypothetical protein
MKDVAVTFMPNHRRGGLARAPLRGKMTQFILRTPSLNR